MRLNLSDVIRLDHHEQQVALAAPTMVTCQDREPTEICIVTDTVHFTRCIAFDKTIDTDSVWPAQIRTQYVPRHAFWDLRLICVLNGNVT